MALILITDDAAFSRRMLKKVLSKGDHICLEAGNGVECLEALEIHKPDCILLDLLMPELDGFGVLETLNKQENQPPIIVLSADIQDSARERCLELGAFAMLKKPPKGDEILETIEHALNT